MTDKILVDKSLLQQALAALNYAVAVPCSSSGDQSQEVAAINALQKALAAQSKSEEYWSKRAKELEKVFQDAPFVQAQGCMSGVSAPQPAEPIGKLAVFDDADSDLGWSYDIAANQEQHKKLRELDGAFLYTASPTAYHDPVLSGKNTPQRVMERCHALCPSDLSHRERMSWMADYYEKNRTASQHEPLSDKQIIDKLMYLSPGCRADLLAFARAIEAAHNIGNKP